MISIRLKDLLMAQYAFNRFMNTPMTPRQAMLFVGVGERLQDELQEFNIAHKSLILKHGLNESIGQERTAKEHLINKELRELSQETEINYPHEAVSLSKLRSIRISVLDLVMMQRIGIIKNGK